MNVSITEINYWFVEYRGKAMGLAGAAVSCIMLGLLPIFMMYEIEEVGWRGTYRLLGFACCGFLFPLVLMFFRETPETYNLFPDGKFPEREKEKPIANIVKEKTITALSWEAARAIRSPAFICYSLADLVIAATGTAFFFHLRSFVEDANLSKTIVHGMYPMLAIVSIFGRLVSGYAIDKFGCRYVAIGSQLASATALFLIGFCMNNYTAFFILFLLAFGTSTASNVRSTVHANFFGRKELGKIQSVASSLTVLGSALGPMPFGLTKDLTGSFDLAFIISGVISVITALVVFRFGSNPNLLLNEEKAPLELNQVKSDEKEKV